MKKEHKVEIRKIVEESRVIINKWNQYSEIPFDQIWEDIDGKEKIVQLVSLSMLLAAHPALPEQMGYKIADVIGHSVQQYVLGNITEEHIDGAIEHVCENLGLIEVVKSK